MSDKVPTTVDEKVECALELRAAGSTWTAIAREIRMDRSNLRKALKVRGIVNEVPELPANERRSYFAERWAQILDEAASQLAEALDQRQIPPRQLPIVAGIAQDKLAILAGWNRPGPAGERNWLDALAERLQGVRLELRVEPSTTIDVTSQKDASGRS